VFDLRMETGKHLEPGEGWGREGAVGGEEWARLHALLELVRQENQRAELSPERREQIRERVLARWERYEARRRRVRAFVVGASAVLLAGLIVSLVVRARDA
jgi:hypothetical protein